VGRKILKILKKLEWKFFGNMVRKMKISLSDSAYGLCPYELVTARKSPLVYM